MPIAKPRKKGANQLSFDTEWTEDRLKENTFINKIRERVGPWRKAGYPGVTSVTRTLLTHWNSGDRPHPFFFCQIEAIETAIFLAEVAKKGGETWIESELQEHNSKANPLLYRIAFKMATGSGKTVVMAMLIAWHALNKLANPQDTLFSDTFLVITPGITIRDRLRVLLPSDPSNYYKGMDIVPTEMREQLGQAKVLVTNFHAFSLREKMAAGKITKSILNKGEINPFLETSDQMVRRVCRALGTKQNIVVLNDEAHHCYRRKVDALNEVLKGDDRKEAEKREEEARIWISGVEAVKSKIGLRAIYDLSATPFFLRGSGYPEGTLFPWVVSDFSLIDAIESGIVKVPRVPVSDNSMTGEQPTYRDIWTRIKEGLPIKNWAAEKLGGEPNLPKELEGALKSLYANYEKYYQRWEKNETARAKGLTPPVFIVVCNNTAVSKLVYDYVAGWEKPTLTPSPLPQGEGLNHSVVVPGHLPLFSNVEGDRWSARPNTILVDSAQLESGEGMSDEFKKLVATEIEEFKAEYRERFPGRDTDDLTDEDLLREVMNTVGKVGKLGEQIKCVVSVSMLTEGWDANTVTHILGVRAFGTQLLCEQVVGRGLRRMSYALGEDGLFVPEYAEVYGVPFSFIPSAGSSPDPRPGPMPTHVRSMEDRLDREITFPRLAGYRYELPAERIAARFSSDSAMVLSTEMVPTRTENAPIVGLTSVHTLDELKDHREQEVVFLLSKKVLETYFRDEENALKPWLFPQVLGITREWLATQVRYKDNTFPQLLLLAELAHEAANKIYLAIVAGDSGSKRLMPVLRPYDTLGSTRYVDFDTIRSTYQTNPTKCHISHVVADTDSWEQKMAETLEGMDQVHSYVKNHNLGFSIPYTIDGEEHKYIPDFIVRLDDGHGEKDLLNLIVEVTGARKSDKELKVSTAKTLWVPSVNNHGGFGRWAFLEITDPWDAERLLKQHLQL